MVDKPPFFVGRGDHGIWVSIKNYTLERKPQLNPFLLGQHGGSSESLEGHQAVPLTETPIRVLATDAKGNNHIVEFHIVEQSMQAEDQMVLVDVVNKTGYCVPADTNITVEDPMVSSTIVEPDHSMVSSRMSEANFVPVLDKDDPAFNFFGDHMNNISPLPDVGALSLNEPLPRTPSFAVLGAASMDMNLTGANTANTSAASSEEEMKD